MTAERPTTERLREAANEWHRVLASDPLLPDCLGTHMMGYATCQRLALAAAPVDRDGLPPGTMLRPGPVGTCGAWSAHHWQDVRGVPTCVACNATIVPLSAPVDRDGLRDCPHCGRSLDPRPYDANRDEPVALSAPEPKDRASEPCGQPYGVVEDEYMGGALEAEGECERPLGHAGPCGSR